MIGLYGMSLAGMAIIAEVPLVRLFCTPRNHLLVFASAGCSSWSSFCRFGQRLRILDPGLASPSPDDGLPFCHYPRLCNSHLHGTAL